ncbi:acyl-CoA dehydrogenase family protein [Rouxiella sp. Mn2063]|uniref:acyl-CoA dehydrogenase family protein n=1 Tax=Rouxiella sp. Mn2063 TaxID=3395262 RepID=UPI003BDD7645
MDLDFTPQEEAFRQEVRRFISSNLPPSLADKVKNGLRLSKQDMESWHAILNKQGWLASHWPQELGGAGWSVMQQFIFDNECAAANAPRIVPFGLSMLGPVMIKYGSEQQKRYWLPRILDGSDWWCQGYSEPGAGSDLAGLTTRAVRDGDEYIVNGQKTWTTLGHFANMIFCLVRTNSEVKKQQGISFLLIDMSSPGVEVRPIITLDGAHEVNEVFFTDVRVPVANRIGEENKGWTYAKYLLTYERTNIAGVGNAIAALMALKQQASKRYKRGKSLLDDAAFAARVARVEIALKNMRTTNLRVISTVANGGAPGAESSMLKVKGTQIRQEISALARRAEGVYAQPYIPQNPPQTLANNDSDLAVGPAGAATVGIQYFNNRKLSIFGGSNEIQKNIICKMILGL